MLGQQHLSGVPKHSPPRFLPTNVVLIVAGVIYIDVSCPETAAVRGLEITGLALASATLANTGERNPKV